MVGSRYLNRYVIISLAVVEREFMQTLENAVEHKACLAAIRKDLLFMLCHLQLMIVSS
jgi:hypothetical protein